MDSVEGGGKVIKHFFAEIGIRTCQINFGNRCKKMELSLGH